MITYAPFLLPIIVIMGLLSFISRRPSQSAAFLFLESVLLTLLLAISGKTPLFIGTSVLLTFFALVLIGLNFYIGISYTKSRTKMSKITIAVGFIALAWYFFNSHKIPDFINTNLSHNIFINFDGLSLIICGFILFSMLVASLNIFDIKNSKTGRAL